MYLLEGVNDSYLLHSANDDGILPSIAAIEGQLGDSICETIDSDFLEGLPRLILRRNAQPEDEIRQNVEEMKRRQKNQSRLRRSSSIGSNISLSRSYSIQQNRYSHDRRRTQSIGK